MQEKFLVKPPPRYIFDMLISTFQKTGYPAGLFTDDEMNAKYFEEVYLANFRMSKTNSRSSRKLLILQRLSSMRILK
jgi:hypothetical protein